MSNIVAVGLKCFECKMDSDHICTIGGTQEGPQITCKSGENACAKNAGGTVGIKPNFVSYDWLRIFTKWVSYFHKFDLQNEFGFSNFDILEALGVTMYSGGCKNATKEGCNTKEFPLIDSTGIECLCKSDLCNNSYRFIGSYLFIGFFVINVLLFNKWSIAIIEKLINKS